MPSFSDSSQPPDPAVSEAAAQDPPEDIKGPSSAARTTEEPAPSTRGLPRPLPFEQHLHDLEKKIDELRSLSSSPALDLSEEIETLSHKLRRSKSHTYSNLTPWQTTQLARHPDRPYTQDYIRLLFEDFVELHGGRQFPDDPSIVAGVARFRGRPVAVAGHQKGRDTEENVRRNFGMPHPEGYRKALRIMKLANKFGHPVINFIDTPGAYPGLEAEERGQAEAIARNIYEMSFFEVPVVAVVIGEGGSGGALALGVADAVLMLEHSIYSVISPEGCASILWKDATQANKAADALKLTASDLFEMDVIDEVLPEPLGGAHRDPHTSARTIGEAVERHLASLCSLPRDELIERRFERFRRLGIFHEGEED